jgi:hypothetical protein
MSVAQELAGLGLWRSVREQGDPTVLKSMILHFGGFLAVAGGLVLFLIWAEIVSFPTGWSFANDKPQQFMIRYLADEGLPTDDAGEKRRDYAVLEAALNDLASPLNPEHKHRIRSRGPGKQVVINIAMEVADQITDEIFGLDRPNRNVHGADA